MEQNANVRFVFFDQTFVQRVIAFTELSDDKKTKEAAKTLSNEIKGTYAQKDAELKQQIKEQLVTLKQEHLRNLEQLENDLSRGLAEANAKELDAKELHNVKFGLETVCKRAKIKEKNSYN